MRFGKLILFLALPLIVACKLLPQGLDQPPSDGHGTSGIVETPVTEGTGKAVSPAIRPKPRPVSDGQIEGVIADPDADALPAVESLPPEPVAQKSKEQSACEKRGGNWGKAGKSNLSSCIRRTRDGGKQCRKQTDCDSVCLARSGTCAPVKPLFGCNEILQNDGSRVTLCID